MRREKEMDYNYEDILVRYQEKYARLAEQAAPGSLERRAYDQIVQLISHNKVVPLKERAFQLTITFMTFAQTAHQAEARAIFKQCVLDFNRDTGQEPLQLE